MVGVHSLWRGMKIDDAAYEKSMARNDQMIYGDVDVPLYPASPGDEEMPTFIAGDVHLPPPTPAPLPQVPQPTNGLANSLVKTVVGAGLVAGGMALNNYFTADKTPAPKTTPVIDTDTIGVLEPDKGD